MAHELKGKVAIVTGGASGMGRETVRVFVEEGARVVLADIQEDAGRATAEQFGAEAAFCRADVSNKADVENLVAFAVKRYGDLDIMFNNAGIAGSLNRIALIDDEFEEFDRVMKVDLLGVMLGTKFAARHMCAKRKGAIISTASTAGFFGGYGIPIYRAAKAGVINFTQMAAFELGSYGVRINAISPGPIETPILGGQLNLSPEKAAKLQREMMDIMVAAQAMPRYGQALDIANAAVFLASDRAAQITGHNLVVSGGMTIGDPVDRMEGIARAFQNAMSG